ncbi:MAG: nuclear transport factor 2 family protein [Sedimentisphaerales bacterium]|nr:nuclear transport factor 2 family protein [Sedimentisphaerales bacterium]
MSKYLVYFGVVVVVCGCGVLGPTDAELVALRMGEWEVGLVERDVERMMENYSEDFVSSDGERKEAIEQIVRTAIAEGYLAGMEVDLEDAEVTVDGTKAEVYPVLLDLPAVGEQMRYKYRLKKKEGEWLIVGSEEY